MQVPRSEHSFTGLAVELWGLRARGRDQRGDMSSRSGRDELETRRNGRFARAATGDVPEKSALESRAIVRARTGDPAALHFLYVRYADSVRAYVDSIVRNPQDAEDIAQSLFASLPAKVKRYEPQAVPVAAWLLRVARNAALDHLRGRRSIPFEEVHTSGEGSEELGVERSEALRSALDGLPPDQREVLVLRHVVGLSPGEIAQRLSRSESSIHGLHHRGRSALQAALLDSEAGPVIAAG